MGSERGRFAQSARSSSFFDLQRHAGQGLGGRGMRLTEYTTLQTDQGPVRARAPLVVSASRRTDIPAFYADWFFARLAAGFCATVNPCNGVRSWVSFERTRFVVFWSKNPRPLLPYLPFLRKLGMGCCVHYTLNDYTGCGLEHVPVLDVRLETFRLLAEELGREAVIWRFDPLLLADDLSVEELLARVARLGERVHKWTRHLVFSFADIAPYRKVRHNLARLGVRYREWSPDLMQEFARGLARLNCERGWNLELATCCEEADLAACGIGHGRCIDPALIARLTEDEGLLRAMGLTGRPLPGTVLDASSLPGKDRGQRALCGCMEAVDIGEYNTCPHLCAYCYANASESSVLANVARHKKNPRAALITAR